MKIKNSFYNFIHISFKFRHQIFEYYYRSIFIKKLKDFIKKLLPNIIFNFFNKNKINYLKQFPESFSIETVNICNAKCWFCPQPDHKRKKGYMKFEVFKKIIDEISIYRNRVKSIAMFMDGDPTLHKELINFLIYAKQKKLRIYTYLVIWSFFQRNL